MFCIEVKSSKLDYLLTYDQILVEDANSEALVGSSDRGTFMFNKSAYYICYTRANCMNSESIFNILHSHKSGGI